MKNKLELIYEGKAKKIFSHEDPEKVIIEIKDDEFDKFLSKIN